MAVQELSVASKAKARFQRVSARKAQLLADAIRGCTVAEARNILRFSNRPSAAPIMMNLLKSAVANVDHGVHPNADELIVGEIMVDRGPIMYRMRPRARGRATRIRKRFCHISMKLCV
jgi:large subunit ribosomal protein L22